MQSLQLGIACKSLALQAWSHQWSACLLAPLRPTSTLQRAQAAWRQGVGVELLIKTPALPTFDLCARSITFQTSYFCDVKAALQQAGKMELFV